MRMFLSFMFYCWVRLFLYILWYYVLMIVKFDINLIVFIYIGLVDIGRSEGKVNIYIVIFFIN